MVVNTRGLLLKLTTLAITVVGGGVFLASNTYAAPTIGLSLNTSNLNIGTLNQTTPFIKNTHNLTITSTDTLGYTLTLSTNSTNTNSNKLTNTSDNNQTINPTTGTLNSKSQLANNTWGYTLTTNSSSLTQTSNVWSKVPTKQTPDTIVDKNTNTSEQINITYGAYLQNAHRVKAGTYQTTVEYTATAKIPAPTLTNLILNDTIETDRSKEFALRGTNLSYVNSIWVDYNNNGKKDSGEEATGLTIYSNTSQKDTEISFTNPIATANNTDRLGNGNAYDLYAESPGGTAKLAKAFHVIPQSICENANTNNDCQVDIDANMIPITYDHTDTANYNKAYWRVANINTKGDWYNYNQKKWANAVTVKADKLNTYKNQVGKILNENDILGYWAYIPRYSYEVQRPNAIDRYVLDEYGLPNSHALKNDFNIRFQKKTDTKLTPNYNTASCNPISGTTLTAKDYRTECAAQLGISRIYGASTGTTWATHPAFIFGDKELNGIWVGKFEMTGKRTAPTVMPNQVTNIFEHIGNLYTMAKSIGVNDPVNTYGNNISGITQNSHNLAKSTSHMLKNREWGAASYLSSSMYGAGVNNVQINAAMSYSNNTYRNQDQDGQSSYSGTTGCGPSANGDTSTYADGTKLDTTTISSLTACSQNTERAYNGSIGQLASTTNNIYGIYDMSGGAWEYTMGNRSTSDTVASNNTSYEYVMTNKPTNKYTDIYSTTQGFGTKPTWSSSTNEYHYNNDTCTWLTCGGHALNETKTVQSVSSVGQSWGGDYSSFAYSIYPWFVRGGGANYGSFAGLFFTSIHNGYGSSDYGGRAALLPEI